MTALVEAHSVALHGRLAPTDLHLSPGEMVALVGPNGGGKTSLLRALAQVDGASGNVTIAGEPLCDAHPNRRSNLVGFLPASRELAWPIAVRDLVRLGHSAPAPIVDAVLEELELTDLAGRRVDRLSTGERARTLVGRLLAASPRIYLLDEPLSNLDPYWVRALLRSVRARVRDEPCCVLVSLHDLAQLHAFDRVVMVAGGKLVFDGTPVEMAENPVFPEVFRVTAAQAGLNPSADPQSSR